jgi:hypothetical protein
LTIVPAGGGTPSTILKAAVLTGVTVTRPGPTSFSVSVLVPLYLVANIYARLWIRAGYSPTAVATAIRAALIDWFAPNEDDGTPNLNVDFGYYRKDENGVPSNILALSDIVDVVRDTTGVLRLGTALADFTLNGVHADLTIGLREFPAVGTVILQNGATGAFL